MISKVSISLIFHATEDQSRVEQALLNLLPEGMRGSAQVKYAVAKGHHGNEIRVASLEEEGSAAKSVVDYITKLLPPGDLLRLRDEVDRYFDSRSTFFMRLDKQKAFSGQLRLSESDDIIRVKISVQLHKGDHSKLFQILNLG
ncbi:MAG: RNA-binding domain-containing protein [Candidatus Methanosuratincola sp.]